MRKTKIICTLGPSTDKGNVLRDMVLAGMNVARFNFSHADHSEHLARLKKLRSVCKELKTPVAALLDTKGPEIRLGTFEGGSAQLVTGQTFTLTTRDDVVGNSEICSISYKELPSDVEIGSTILLDDGLISLRVEKLEDTEIVCRVENDGLIKNTKGVNVPDVSLTMPYMSQRDCDDILFGIENGFDFIAASFVRSAEDIMEIRRLLDANNSNIRIIAKIENREGVDNISEILSVADGVMVARGDLGVEIDFAQIPMIQKDIIRQSYTSGKPIVTATQMLESMINHPRPTRAETTDVANAIYDGTSAIMLSGETAAGKYPVEAVRTMASIAECTESDIHYLKWLRRIPNDCRMNIADATAHAACTTARDTRANAIITVSASGKTARLISKYRPETPIIACVMNEEVQRQLCISWGVTPILIPFVQSTDELISHAVDAAQAAGCVAPGDLVVVTAGVPVGVAGTTNMIKAHLVGDALLAAVGIGEQTATGPLCVCRTMEEVHSKFKPGDVLVVPYTTNEMLDIFRDAAAVISEESGLNSHAAIVGLTLNKPVIVGANGATRRLSDGQMVTVDCGRGIVQNIPM